MCLWASLGIKQQRSSRFPAQNSLNTLWKEQGAELPHSVISLHFEIESLKWSRKANRQGWWGTAISGTAALTSLTFPSVSFNYTTALSQHARWLCM